MLGLKPIKLLPARERVASALRKAIIAQQIKEGETLTLETTAQQLGVSITPVREAFQILERDGLISLQQNRGATVLGINEKTLREHYQVRAVLEKAACELCCENGADLSSVKNCIDTAEEALERNDVTDYANQNQSFHYEIWKAAGNGKLENSRFEMVSVGPTTSMRMEKFEKEFVRDTGVRVIVGKGGMGPNTEYACRNYRAIHCVFPAGNAVVAATEVEEIVEAQWQDLGMPETLWHCHVKEFGPLIVSIDTEGRNLFEENKVLFNKRKDEATAEICRHVSFIK